MSTAREDIHTYVEHSDSEGAARCLNIIQEFADCLAMSVWADGSEVYEAGELKTYLTKFIDDMALKYNCALVSDYNDRQWWLAEEEKRIAYDKFVAEYTEKHSEDGLSIDMYFEWQLKRVATELRDLFIKLDNTMVTTIEDMTAIPCLMHNIAEYTRQLLAFNGIWQHEYIRPEDQEWISENTYNRMDLLNMLINQPYSEAKNTEEYTDKLAWLTYHWSKYPWQLNGYPMN